MRRIKLYADSLSSLAAGEQLGGAGGVQSAGAGLGPGPHRAVTPRAPRRAAALPARAHGDRQGRPQAVLRVDGTNLTLTFSRRSPSQFAKHLKALHYKALFRKLQFASCEQSPSQAANKSCEGFCL